MKTLILTSAGFKTAKLQKDLLKVLPQPPGQLNLSYITTASKVSPDPSFVERDRKVLTDLGFKITEFDLTGKSLLQLKSEFKGKHIIWVEGGNTFYLLKQIKASGFDRLIKDLIKRGIVYIGVSAGSYIACPTIEMATWKGNQNPRFGLTDLTALNLVPFLLSVHYNREKYREGIKEGVLRSKFPVRILTDDQALLVQDGEVRLIGEGEEIKLQ